MILTPSLVELGLDLRHVAELGRADRREVARVREEHGPRVADPVVELDRAFRRLGLEVRCGFTELNCHLSPLVASLTVDCAPGRRLAGKSYCSERSPGTYSRRVAGVSITLLGGFSAAVAGGAGPGAVLAAEESARPRQAARALSRPAAPPRAGDGSSLARPATRLGREQPLPGCSRRQTRPRARGDRGPRAARDPRRRSSTSSASSRLRPRPAAREPPTPTGQRSRLPRESSSPRTATTTGRRRAAPSSTSCARSSASSSPRSGRSASDCPADASSFIGRDRELTELRRLLARTRLLTLVGTGGAGKTRLALELARSVEPQHADGAVLVELALVTSPERTVDALAAALDVERPSRPLAARCQRGLPRGSFAPPRRRQLRASARRELDARRHDPEGGTAGRRSSRRAGSRCAPRARSSSAFRRLRCPTPTGSRGSTS